MGSITTARKVGGSLVVTIPAEVAKLQNINENDLLEIEVKKKRRNYFGALKGIGKFTEEDELKGQLDE